MVDFIPPFLNKWFLLIFFILEFFIKFGLNPTLIEIVEEHSLYEKISTRQRSASLSVAALVFAGLAIIFSGTPQSLTLQIEFFATAFALLLIAVFAHELTRTRQFLLTIQEMAFEYGLLFLALGVHLLVVEFVPPASDVTFTAFLLVSVFRFLSVKGEFEAHRNQFDNRVNTTRRAYLCEVICQNSSESD